MTTIARFFIALFALAFGLVACTSSTKQANESVAAKPDVIANKPIEHDSRERLLDDELSHDKRQDRPESKAAAVPSPLQEFAKRKVAPTASVAGAVMAAPEKQEAPWVDHEKYAHLDQNGILQASEHPVSTFSIDVDTGAYANVRRMLKAGQLPQQDAVRVVLFGEAAEKIQKTVNSLGLSQMRCTLSRVNGLHEAVLKAAEVAESGDVVLLSPGGTSFDEFKDFAERGERFRAWVQELS